MRPDAPSATVVGVTDDPTVQLLQEHIRNACVNDGTAESGHEERSVRTLAEYFGVEGECSSSPPAASPSSTGCRIRPRRPVAGVASHLDVVPVNPEGWSVDPFAAEIADGFVWGRGRSTCSTSPPPWPPCPPLPDWREDDAGRPRVRRRRRRGERRASRRRVPDRTTGTSSATTCSPKSPIRRCRRHRGRCIRCRWGRRARSGRVSPPGALPGHGSAPTAAATPSDRWSRRCTACSRP